MIIRAEDAPRFEAGGTTAIGYASPSRGSSETSAWRISIDPGSESPVHRLEHEEVFMSLSGSATATIDGGEQAVGPADCLVVPAGVDFQLRATGEHPFEAVVCMPAGARVSTTDEEGFVPPWAA